MHKVAVFALALQCATAVHGHGYLSYPPARNINDTCKQCLSAGSPFWHLAPFNPGFCGNSAKDPIQNWNVPGEPQVIYKEGQIFDVAVC
jgi:predicted carbohydrate-binding protein with CBM5 and CBM33 domain